MDVDTFSDKWVSQFQSLHSLEHSQPGKTQNFSVSYQILSIYNITKEYVLAIYCHETSNPKI